MLYTQVILNDWGGDSLQMEEDMKFDKIIMNPPYCGNLHLKILREAMQLGKEAVNLSPIRWLQDPLADRKRNTDYKKFSDIRKHIESIDEISREDATKLFGAAFYTDLGIYKLDKKEHNFEYKRDAFIEKMLDTFAKGPRFTYENKMSGEYELVLPAVHGHLGKNDWSEITSKDWNVAVNVKASSVTNGYVILRFDSKDERKNFYDSLFTKFYRFFVGKLKTTAVTAQYIKFLPMMPTYTHPWTDEMLYDYFGLTQEERETIENEV